MTFYIIRLRGFTTAMVVSCVDHEDLTMLFSPANYAYLCDTMRGNKIVEFSNMDDATRIRDMINGHAPMATRVFV